MGRGDGRAGGGRQTCKRKASRRLSARATHSKVVLRSTVRAEELAGRASTRGRAEGTAAECVVGRPPLPSCPPRTGFELAAAAPPEHRGKRAESSSLGKLRLRAQGQPGADRYGIVSYWRASGCTEESTKMHPQGIMQRPQKRGDGSQTVGAGAHRVQTDDRVAPLSGLGDLGWVVGGCSGGMKRAAAAVAAGASEQAAADPCRSEARRGCLSVRRRSAGQGAAGVGASRSTCDDCMHTCTRHGSQRRRRTHLRSEDFSSVLAP